MNVRSVEWRYGKEQIAINKNGRWALVQHWSFLVLKLTCCTVYMYAYISVTLYTNLELQKAESFCKTRVAINVFE